MKGVCEVSGVRLRILRIGIGARPGLVEVEHAAGAAEVEGGLGGGTIGGRTRVDHSAVEEVGELVARAAARDLVLQRRVRHVEVHVPPRVLVRRRREHVAAVEVEVLDRPLEVVERLRLATRVGVPGGGGGDLLAHQGGGGR